MHKLPAIVGHRMGRKQQITASIAAVLAYPPSREFQDFYGRQATAGCYFAADNSKNSQVTVLYRK
jgi:hypothetical protein